MTLNTLSKTATWCLSTIEGLMVNVQRCFALLKIPQENSEGKDSVRVFKSINPHWPREGHIEFDKVVLRYRPNTDIVLNELSFKIAPGEKIGVVGRTGAGKSTICLSMSRIVEITEG